MSTPLVTPNLLAQLRTPALPALSAAPVMPTPLSLPVPTAPLVSKIPTAMDLDQKRVDDLHTQGAGVSQIQNPLLRGIARAGDIAASVFLPGFARSIPGTTLNHQVEINRAERNLANDQATQKAADASADSESQARQRDSAANKADALAAADTPIPMTAELAQAAGAPQLEGISMTPRDYQRLVANHQTVQGRITTNQATNDTRQSISDDKLEAAATAAAAKPEQRDDHYISIMSKPASQRTPDDLAYKQGYEGYIKAKMTDPRVAGALARPLQVVLPNGQAGYETAGTAIRTGATGLGDNSYKAQGAALKDFTSGTDSHTLTAFNTAQGHIKQLNAAADALQNGDIQALNRLANAYGTATGASAPAVFQGVKTAVSGEIAKAFTGAGATVDEISEVRKSINDAESPQQLKDVAASYSHLLDTKKGVLQQQLDSAKKGQANFGNNQSVKKFNPATGRLE